MSKNLIHLIAGARPNFMKIAPLARAFDTHPDTFRYEIVHTGQHYDQAMSDVFFDELGIPQPTYHLGCGGGSHAEQTAKIMVAYEKLCLTNRPDMVLVVGDVNSTLACAIVAKKLHIQVAHIEAGLRSGDRSMPEEINRLVTDSISDLFFVTEPAGENHLLREGHSPSSIHHVGHVMVDNVIYQRDKLNAAPLPGGLSEDIKKEFPAYGVLTLHRPSNVDDMETFQAIADVLIRISDRLPLVFPVHPRTRANMERFGIDLGSNVTLLDPLGYMEFLNLWKDAKVVLTDSGGLQEETTALGVPCITIRENTERPITIDEGTNVLAGTDPTVIEAAVSDILTNGGKAGKRPELWDGRAAERIVAILSNLES